MSDLQRPNVSGWFATSRNEETGERALVTRTKACECGRIFTQHQLGERFMLMAERHSESAVGAVMRDIPDLFVPVNCPACERKALGYGRPDSLRLEPVTRRRMEDRERFARNLGRLCAAWNKPMDAETSETYWFSLERTLTDEEFERGVLAAIGGEKKWPVPAVVAAYGRAA